VTGDLARGEVAVAVIHRLEFAAVDRDAITLQRTDPAAQLDKPGAGLTDGHTIACWE
jgi:hypothetical protein